MPFGLKPGPKDPRDTNRDAPVQLIDFNRVYTEYIQPALQSAGFEPFRADQEIRAGDIRADMFQELLVADLVVADLTIDNPNVWYELGVRHALRARGVVIICGGTVTTAFDLYTDRKLRYGLKDGAPDPAQLEEDKRKLAEMVKATMDAWHGRKVSPVYDLMPNLQEPDWKSLRIGDAREFWEQHEAWEHRIELARRAGRVGDLLVLANEAPIAAFRAEAWIEAGEALRRAERYQFALEHLAARSGTRSAQCPGPARNRDLPAATRPGGRARPFASTARASTTAARSSSSLATPRPGRCSGASTRMRGPPPGTGPAKRRSRSARRPDTRTRS